MNILVCHNESIILELFSARSRSFSGFDLVSSDECRMDILVQKSSVSLMCPLFNNVAINPIVTTSKDQFLPQMFVRLYEYDRKQWKKISIQFDSGTKIEKHREHSSTKAIFVASILNSDISCV